MPLVTKCYDNIYGKDFTLMVLLDFYLQNPTGNYVTERLLTTIIPLAMLLGLELFLLT